MLDQAELAQRLAVETATAWEPEVQAQADADPERHNRQLLGEAGRCLALAELVAPARPSRVLEVGIGYLGMTTTIRAVFGDDIEVCALEHPARASLSSREFQQRVEAQRVTLRQCDVLTDDIPFAGLFDVVLFCDVIEHLPVTHVPDVVAKLAAAVRPGGRLVMSSTNLPAFIRVASLALGRGNIFDPPFPLDYAGGTYGHIRLYGKADIAILVDRLGLDMAEWRFLNWERDFLDRDTLMRRLVYVLQGVLPRVIPHLATSWICAVTPPEPIKT